jgi:peptide/nickel transport system substrate-binding protein
MGIRRSILYAILLLAMITLSVLPIYLVAQGQNGGASNSITFISVSLDRVGEAFRAGSIDAYIYGLRPSQLDQFQGISNIRFISAPGGLVSLVLNPAPVKTVNLTGDWTKKSLDDIAKAVGYPKAVISQVYYDKDKGVTYVDLAADGSNINPFALKDVRYAMNYIIDRDFIVRNIYRGYGAPMVTFLSNYDPTYMLISDLVATFGITYNPGYARSLIEKALTAAGATLVSGKWYYAGKPIQIIFIIRTEDERRDIGDLVATELENLGFVVNKQYLTFAQALEIVYDTDPKELQWHIYTEGWGKGALEKYDSATPAQMCAPWYGYMPGWQTEGWWWYRNDTLDELTQKLYFGTFTSFEDYKQTYRNVTAMCMQESVRIWVATRMDIHVVRADAQGITEDLSVGLRSPFNLKALYIPGKPDITIGHLWVYTSRTIWNIYGGFTDVYSVDIERATYDPLTWRDPFNGEPIPIRVKYSVTTAGPNGTLSVPSDAIIWDASQGKWVNVASGTTAKSVVKYDMSMFIGAKWHDGINITWGDILAAWALWFDLVYNNSKASFETPISGPNKPFFDTIKGLRIVPENNTLEVYVDYWHFDPNYIADYAALTPINPAESLILQNIVVFDMHKYAFTTDTGRAKKLPTLNLVLKNHASDLASLAQQLLAGSVFPSKYFTTPQGTYMSLSEWKARLQAFINWVNQHGHAWISQGPYYLDTFDDQAQKAVIKAFRDPSYPFNPSYWVKGSASPPMLTVPATPTIVVGNATSFIVNIVPPTITAGGRTTVASGNIYVQYIIKDVQTGTVVDVGQARLLTSGATMLTYQITIPSDITKRMAPYNYYQILIYAFSEAVAVPAFTSITLQAQPSISQMIAGIVTGQVAPVQQQVSDILKRMQQMELELSNTSRQFTLLGQQLGQQLTGSLQQVVTLLQQQASATSDVAKLIGSVGQQLNTLAINMSAIQSTMQRSVSDLSNAVNKVSGDVIGVSTSVSDLKSSITELNNSVAMLNNYILALTALVVVLIILNIVLLIRVLKK